MTYQELIDYCKQKANNSYFQFPDLRGIDQLPPEIGLLKNLNQISLNNGNIKELPPEIGMLESLEYMRLSGMPLTKFPKEIGSLQKLQSFALENVPIEDFSFLSDLPNLQSLILIDCNLELFPKEIQELKNLKILNISKNRIKSLPEWFPTMHNLNRLLIQNNPLETLYFGEGNKKMEILNFENCRIKEIPESIGFMTALQSLMLKKNKLSGLPDSLAYLSNLQSLNISKNPLKSFPNNLKGLNNLRFFQFDEAWMEQFPYSLLALGSLVKVPKGRKVSARAAEIPALAREVVKKEYSKAFAYYLMDLLAERWEMIEQHENTAIFLLDTLNCSLPVLQNLVFAKINDRYLSTPDAKLCKGSVLCVLGKTSFNLSELKTRLASLDLEYSSKLNNKVTHLVLGRLHKADTASILLLNPVLLTENNLLDYLNQVDTPYLLEETEVAGETSGHNESLSALLMSPQSENIELALQMLRSGGVPDGLFTELALIYFNDYPKKIRDSARKLLEQYGPPGLKPFFSKVSSPIRTVMQSSHDRKFKLHFETICEEYGFDKIKILQYWMVREEQRWDAVVNIVRAYALRLLAEPEALNILKKCITGTTLNMKRWDLSLVPESLMQHKDLVDHITAVKLHSCSLLKFPGFLLSYKKLTLLELDNNSIRSIPKEIRKLSNLESLSLNGNNLKVFPGALVSLDKLINLSLGNCLISEIGSELKDMPKLESLSIFNNKFADIPSVLFEMTQLKHLNVKRLYNFGRATYKDKKVAELQTALPDCEIIT